MIRYYKKHHSFCYFLIAGLTTMLKKINTSKKKTEPYNEKGFPSLKHMLTKNFKNSGSLDEIKKRIAEATLIVSDLQENNLHYFENENLSKLKQSIKDLFVTNTNADAG